LSKKTKILVPGTKDPTLPVGSAEKKRDLKWLYEILAILVVVFLVYGNSIMNDYNLDDPYVVSLDKVNTQTMKGIKGIPEILFSSYNEGEGVTYGYRPLGKVTMAIEYSLWGNNPHLSHAVNILLYALNIFLLLLFIRQVANLFNYKNELVIYLSLLLFAVHPIHTEVVCSIKNREEILCFIFVLFSLLLFIRFVLQRNLLLFLPIALCTLLAFWSKQTAVTIFGYAMLYMVFRSGIIIRLLRLNFSYVELKIYDIYLLSYLGPAFVFLFHYIAVVELYPARWEIIMLKGTVFILPFTFFLAGFLYKRASLLNALKRSGIPGGRDIFYRSASLSLFCLLHFLFIYFNLKGYYSLSSALLVGVKMMLFNLLFYAVFAAFMALHTRSIPWYSLLKSGLLTLRYAFLFLLLGGIAILVLDVIPDSVQAPFQADWIEVTFEQNPFAFISDIRLFPTGMNTLLFYLGKLLVPYPLGFYYGYDMIRAGEWLSINTLIGIVLILSTVCCCLYSFKLNKYAFHSFWILALGFSLFPFLNMLQGNFVTGVVGERLAYQASFPFCVLAAMTLLAVAERRSGSPGNGQSRSVRWKMLLPSMAVVIVFSAITVNRNPKWFNKSTLFQHDIQYLSRSARANFMLASNYVLEMGKANPYTLDRPLYINNAKHYLMSAIAIYPNYSDAWLALGDLYFSYRQRPDSAMYCLQKVDTLNKLNYTRARELMGDISYIEMKDLREAYARYKEGFNSRKKNEGLYNKIVQVLFELNEFDSIKAYAAIAIQQGWLQGYVDLGDACYNQGDTARAFTVYEEGLNKGYRSTPLIRKMAAHYQATGNQDKLSWLRAATDN